MIDKQKGKYVFQCDGCDEVLEPGERDFRTAVDALENEGWISKRVSGEWEHYCPRCG